MLNNNSDNNSANLSDLIDDYNRIHTFDDIMQIIAEANNFSKLFQYRDILHLTDEHSEIILKLLLKLGTALRKIDHIPLDINECPVEIKDKLTRINNKLKGLWLGAAYQE